MTERMTQERVAVIVVHGVADQRAGETSRAVVELLVASPPSGVRYAAQTTETFTLPVDPLQPLTRIDTQPEHREETTPAPKDPSPVKAFLQSGRSDFQRKDWKAAETASEAWTQRVQPGLAMPSVPNATPDRGIAVTDYLLCKHVENGATREAYETTCIGMERTQHGKRALIDVYEMYWADLSRLSGALPRIVTELFTIVFRLSKLGRETVDEARGAMERARGNEPGARWYAESWRLTAGLQIMLDWLFVNGLALLMLVLGWMGALLLVLGAMSRIADWHMPLVHRVVTGVIGVLAALLWAYRRRDDTSQARAAPIAVVVASLALIFLFPQWLHWVTLLALLGAISLVNEFCLRIADDRFPFVHTTGHWMWFALLALMLASIVKQQMAGAPGNVQTWIHAALFTTETILLAVKWLWIVVALLLAVWMVAGWIAATERGFESRASVATGRLGLCLSIGAFLALSMGIWAGLSGALDFALRGATYVPCIFPVDATEAAPLLVPTHVTESCLYTSAAIDALRAGKPLTQVSASAFLDVRFMQTTATFSLLAFVILCLLAYLVGMFVPSILAETKLLIQKKRDAFRRAMLHKSHTHRAAAMKAAEAIERGMKTRRLGRWLTAGYKHLDSVALFIFAIAALLGVIVALNFYGLSLLAHYEAPIRNFSQNLLRPMVTLAASITGLLIVLGQVLSRKLPALRGPLDIALDVDNHFREFPRTGIPRARIFSRYAALLRHIESKGYERIVIVSHSQGTVITCELLRYLSSDGKTAPAAQSRPLLNGSGLPPVSLLTLGCPLRQLYASRFPTLYRWVIAKRGAISGPCADDVGVERWINGFCSGDYVGRWLWSNHRGGDQDPVGHPMVDTVDDALFGRKDAYASFDPMPPAAEPFDRTRELEVCLGLGAHTHYFERDQEAVAWLIDDLARPRSITAT